MQYSHVLLVAFTFGLLFLHLFTGWHSTLYPLSGYLQVIDFQVTFSTLICHWWVLVVHSSCCECLITVFGMLSTCRVPSVAKVVLPVSPSELTFQQAPFSVIPDNDSFFTPQANLFLLPFLLHCHIHFPLNPLFNLSSFMLVYAQPPARLDKHPRSTPCMSILSLVEHSSSPSCKLSKLSFIGLVSLSLLLEVAWGDYLNVCLARLWALY